MKQAGFTLLEIMLVIIIMAVVAALLAPRFQDFSTPSLNDEARRLAQALQLASEEAQFTGVPVRWRAYPDHYLFEAWNNSGWETMAEAAFAEHALPEGLQVASIHNLKTRNQSSEVIFGEEPGPATEEAPLGTLLLLPDSFSDMADIRLQREEGEEIADIQVRPGPGGIRVAEQPA